MRWVIDGDWMGTGGDSRPESRNRHFDGGREREGELAWYKAILLHETRT